MKRILVTGMSGTGKSSLLEELQRRGFECVETDVGAWCEYEKSREGWVWREDLMAELLLRQRETALFVNGCVSNQGKFYSLFDRVVLLSAPAEVMLGRIATRTNNPYGKTTVERAEILGNLEFIEPLLRAGCDIEFDTSKFSVQRIANQLAKLVQQ